MIMKEICEYDRERKKASDALILKFQRESLHILVIPLCLKIIKKVRSDRIQPGWTLFEYQSAYQLPLNRP